MIYTMEYLSPLGPVLLASDGESLTGLWNEGQKYFGSTMGGEAVMKKAVPVLAAAEEWLDAYFAGQRPAIASLPLAPQGSSFRKTVWEILCEIPYGGVTTYGEIAREMARRMGKASMSSQAVGGAVGHNPVSIIIPCHRVVGTNGSLTGYAGGIDRKIQLLSLEGADLSGLFVPAKGTAL